MADTSERNTSLERFLASMEYGSADRVPNYELGVWGQTQARWEEEGAPAWTLTWDWFTGEEYFDMDHREFIPVNFGMMPPFETKVLERTDKYEIIQHAHGVVTKALIEGTVRGMRSSMDTYLRFPVETPEDFRELKKRYVADLPRRLPAYWPDRIAGWQDRQHVLVLGQNCAAAGFYWRAREWMGTENLSYAWYDQPAMMHEMMAFFADYTMEVCRPLLERVDVEYFNLNEDLSMKTGPLLSPDTYREFIFPHLKRLVEFFKAHGTRYVILDTDGNCDVLTPMFMDAGVDCIWPLERAAEMDPVR
jgi:uroporphyrinogen decarboxylase